jgi:predicted site-specific integrase-resolvase
MIEISSLTKNSYRPGEIAKMLGVTTRTIQNYCIAGKLEDQIINNRRTIPRSSVIQFLQDIKLLHFNENRKDIIYARVSTNRQKERGDLQRQIDLLEKFVLYHDPLNVEVIQDVGSGLNDNRKGIISLLTQVQQDKVRRIIILHKDRLTRFGFNYIKNVCDIHKTEIVIASDETIDKSISEELAEDIISIIHSFSGKLYGMRKQVREQIDNVLTSGEDN